MTSRPSAGIALTGGASVAALGAALIALGGIELAGVPHADIWSNAWLVGGVVVIVLSVLVTLVLLGMDFVGRSASAVTGGPHAGLAASGDAGQAQSLWAYENEIVETETAAKAPAPRGDPVTDRWQHTADGFKATPLMQMTSYAMPGCMGSRDPSPFIRIGVCVACDPIELETADSSRIRRHLAGFLDHGPVARLIRAITHLDGELTWTPQAGAGALRIDAVLGTGAEPVASAMLHLPFTGLRQAGRADDMACLWLQVALRGESGSQPEPAGLTSWYRRFALVLSIAPALVDVLSRDLGLTVSDQPPARVGVMLQGKGRLTELVDAGDLPELAGANPSSQFLGYAIADPAGKRADDAARDFLRHLCDYDLQVDVTRPFLRSVGLLPEPGSRVRVPWEGGERDGTVVRWQDLEGDDPKVIVAVQVVEDADRPELSVMELAFGADVIHAR